GPLTSIGVRASSGIARASSSSLKNLSAGSDPPRWVGMRCLVGMLGPNPPPSVHCSGKLAGPDAANLISVLGSLGTDLSVLERNRVEVRSPTVLRRQAEPGGCATKKRSEMS